jgi:hypothetical protein
MPGRPTDTPGSSQSAPPSSYRPNRGEEDADRRRSA